MAAILHHSQDSGSIAVSSYKGSIPFWRIYLPPYPPAPSPTRGEGEQVNYANVFSVKRDGEVGGDSGDGEDGEDGESSLLPHLPYLPYLPLLLLLPLLRIFLQR